MADEVKPRIEIRLSDEDWAKYGGPEWLVWDQDPLDDMSEEELSRLERAMDMSFWHLRNVEIPARTARSTRAACWLARQLSGDPELLLPNYADFKMKPLKMRSRIVGGDDLPPPDGSPAGETGETTAEADQGSSKPSGVSGRQRKGSH